MTKTVTFLIVAALVAALAYFFLVVQPGEVQKESSQDMGKSITLPMPKSAPEAAAPPEQPEPENDPGSRASAPEPPAAEADSPEPGQSFEEPEAPEPAPSAESPHPPEPAPPAAEAEAPEPAPSAAKPEAAEPEHPETEPGAPGPGDPVSEAPASRPEQPAAKLQAPEPVPSASTAAGPGVKAGSAVDMAAPAETTPAPARKAAPAETTPRGKLTNAQVSTFDDKVEIHIQTDVPIASFKRIILPDPERLVIDLVGKWEQPKPRKITVEDPLIQGLRLWQYPDKLRIVADFKQKISIPPTYIKTGDGLVVTILRTDES